MRVWPAGNRCGHGSAGDAATRPPCTPSSAGDRVDSAHHCGHLWKLQIHMFLCASLISQDLRGPSFILPHEVSYVEAFLFKRLWTQEGEEITSRMCCVIWLSPDGDDTRRGMRPGARGNTHDGKADATRTTRVRYAAAIHHPGLPDEPALREAAGPHRPCLWHGCLASCHSGIQLAQPQKGRTMSSRPLGESPLSSSHLAHGGSAMRVWPGNSYPLGATWDGKGVNFALFSEYATQVELCFFDTVDAAQPSQLSSRCLNRPTRSGMPTCPRSCRGNSTATGSTARTSRSRATALTPTSWCSTPMPSRLAAMCGGPMSSLPTAWVTPRPICPLTTGTVRRMPPWPWSLIRPLPGATTVRRASRGTRR